MNSVNVMGIIATDCGYSRINLRIDQRVEGALICASKYPSEQATF